MTTFTPEAMRRMVAKGVYRIVTLRDYTNPRETFDEAFYFVYPSLDAEDEVNGEGKLKEIVDVATDFSEIDLEAHGGRTTTVPTTPNTLIYVR
jgi:hypothetical protein